MSARGSRSSRKKRSRINDVGGLTPVESATIKDGVQIGLAPVTPEDIPAIREIERQVIGLGLVSMTEMIFIKAVDQDSRILGFTSGYIGPAHELAWDHDRETRLMDRLYPEKVGILSTVAVSSRSQRKGVGTALAGEVV